MEPRPDTQTDIAVWDASEPIASAELDAIGDDGPIYRGVNELALLDDAICNAGASTAIVERLTQARADHMELWDAMHQEELHTAQADVAGARDKALHLLQELGIKNKTYGHWTAQDVVRNEVAITDQALVEKSLMACGRLYECLRLDLAAVKRVAKELVANEAAIKGLETVTNHSLRLTRSGE